MLTFTLIFLVVLALVLGAISWSLLLVRLSPPEYREAAIGEFPPHAMGLLQPQADELAALGLQFAGLQHEKRSSGPDSWQAVFRSEDGSVWAVAETYVEAKLNRTRLTLQTYFADGEVVLTTNAAFADISIPPNWHLTQRPFDSCAGQVKVHRSTVLAMGAAKGVVHLQSTDELRERYAAVGLEELRHLRDRKYLVPAGDDPQALRFSWWRTPSLSVKALSMAFTTGKEEVRRSGKEREDLGRAKGPDDHPESRYLELYHQQRNEGNLFGKLGWTGKGLVFLLSLVAFMALFYFRGVMDAATLGLVVLILLVHELGHALTMRAFGYRNVQIFFIPFLGAAAAGVKKRVPAWQEFWVFLMGPLPGLLGGWVLLGWETLQPGQLPSWAWDLGFWSVMINGFNLIPFLPLDGGRIVELLIFNRIPIFRVVFITLGAIALLPLAFLSWWFLLLAIVMLRTVPEAVRLARMAKWIDLNLKPEDTEDEALLKTFHIIGQTGNGKVYSKPTWTSFVDRLVQMGCGKQMGFLGTAAALGIYFILFALPLIFAVGLAIKTGWDQTDLEDEMDRQIAILESQVTWPRVPVRDATWQLLDATEEAYWASPADEEFTLGDSNEDIRMLLRSLAEERQAQSGTFHDTALDAARNVRWDEVPTWIENDFFGSRQSIAGEMVNLLIMAADTLTSQGQPEDAARDLMLAYWGILSCEPRDSYQRWRRWIDLERNCLESIERVSVSGSMPPDTKAWLADALGHGLRPTGPKLALLSLYDARSGTEQVDEPVDDDRADRIDAAAMEPAIDEEPVPAEAPAPLSATNQTDEHPADNREVVEDSDTGWQWLREIFSTRSAQSQLAVAAYWAQQEEAAEIPPDVIGGIEELHLVNHGIRDVRRVIHYRQLGATALGITAEASGSRPADLAVPETIEGRVVTFVQDAESSRLILEPANQDEQAMTWRVHRHH